MGWLIALGVLTLIAILPIGVSALYNEDGPRVFVTVGFWRICLFPADKKDKKKAKEKNAEKSAKTTKKDQPKHKKKGGDIRDFLPLVDRVLDFLGSFRRKLRVTTFQMKLILAGGDPVDLAQNYGKAWTVLGNFMPLLDNAFVIKKRDLEVECDFLADTTRVIARLDVSITVGRVVALLVAQGIPVLREFLKISNKRKGGAKK